MLLSSKRIFVKSLNLILLLLVLLSTASAATIVRIQTSFGVIDIQLYDTDAPITVANFLSYVNNNSYNGTFIHRSLPGSIIQGGGYVADLTKNSISLIEGVEIANEFSAERSNVRGTIAMAKRPGDPDSAQSQWFFNLGDNSADLDNQDGGFTVFGKVIGKGMDVIDAITQLPVVNAGGLFSHLPTVNFTEGNKLILENLVILHQFSTNPESSNASDSDRVFSYLEAFYPEFLSPAYPLSPTDSGSILGDGYYYRYYSSTSSYIGTAGDTLYYLGPASENRIISLGSLADWLAQAIAAGY